MTDKEKIITELKEALDRLEYTSDLRLVLIHAIEYLQEEPVRIKKGCKYRCLSDMQNTDTSAISFFKDKIYSAPEDDTLVSEENGWLCDISEDSSNFELVEEPVSEGYRERYKRIAQSEEFKKTYKGMSIGEVMHVEGEESVWIKELQDKLDSLSKEDFEKVWSKYSQYGKGEESISEELEKAAVNAFKQIVDSDKNNFLEIFKAGAKWQKTKDESTTEDLGEYINELSKQFPEVSFAKLSRIAIRVAKWQKKQMVAKAIDGVVTFDYYDSNKTYGCVAHDSFCLEDFGLKDRDKVKVIVIKEE